MIDLNNKKLLTAIQQLDVHDHICLIYQNQQEQFATAIPFIRIGLERKERCVYIADDNTLTMVKEAMQREGIDVEKEIRNTHIILGNKQDSYLKQGYFDPDWMIEFLRESTDQAIKEGYKALRVAGEMTWGLGGDPGNEKVIEYESKLNDFFSAHRALAICQYNAKKFKAKTIKDVIYTHPIVAYGGLVSKNYYYIPPSEFKDNTDRKKVQRLLKNIVETARYEDDVQFHHNILKNVTDSIVVTDLNGTITYWNEGARKIFGYTEKEMIGKNPSVLYPHIDRSTYAEDLQNILEGTDYRGQWEGRRKDGKKIWVDIRTTRLIGTDGSIQGFIGVAKDITHRKQTSDSLELSEKRFRTLVEQTPLSLQIFDPEGNLVLVNKAWEKLWGTTVAKLGRYNILQDIQLNDLGILPFIQKAFQGEIVETPPIRYVPEKTRENLTNVKYRWTRAFIYPVKNVDGSLREIVLIHQDITDRKHAEDELKRSELQFKALYDADIIGVLYCDLEGNIYNANKAFLQMVCYSNQDLKEGKLRWNDLTPKKYTDADAQAVQQLRDTGAVTPFEKEYIRKDGTTIPVIIGAALLDRDRSETIAFVLDISERKRLEQRKDEFISIASHELRTPLTSIKGYTQILARMIQNSSDARTKTMLAKTNSYIDKLSNLIGDLLDISKIQAGKLLLNTESVDINKLIEEVVDSVQPISRSHTLIRQSNEQLIIQGDKQRLEQVLTNLLTNAVKYSPEGGKIIIKYEAKESEIIVSVQDFGVGISEAEHHKLFSRFYRVEKISKQFSGLGIGLYISNEIVMRHKGRMWIESEEGKGSTFYFSLPRS